VINPVYSVFIANLKPEMCPLGAFAFYLHYIYDEKKSSIPWSWIILLTKAGLE
jgi:hypothetical protein